MAIAIPPLRGSTSVSTSIHSVIFVSYGFVKAVPREMPNIVTYGIK
jgi:hypothetical protein